MDRRDFLTSATGAVAALTLAGCGRGSDEETATVRFAADPAPDGTPRILIAGGGFQTAFIGYMAALTGRERPRLCYLPTAAA
ncbi:MAG: twin-arginine translocation signal domain-containing protein, partial [Longimicrobiales bacterium]